MFVTAVCVLFLIKLRWPKKKNFYDAKSYLVNKETNDEENKAQKNNKAPRLNFTPVYT